MLLVLLTMAFALVGCAATEDNGGGADSETVYTVYFGLNDADSGQQVVTVDEAAETIRDAIASRGCGYTEYQCFGAYTEDGVSRENDTLVYIEESDIEAICNEVIEELNLASVLCQKEEVECEFITGE